MAYGPGERIFAEGGDGRRFWLIEAGSLALDMRVPGRGDQIIGTLIGGALLGWSWLHAPYRWHFGAVAREATATIAVDTASVRRRCDADPAFGYTILRCFTPVITQQLQAVGRSTEARPASRPRRGRSRRRGAVRCRPRTPRAARRRVWPRSCPVHCLLPYIVDLAISDCEPARLIDLWTGADLAGVVDAVRDGADHGDPVD